MGNLMNITGTFKSADEFLKVVRGVVDKHDGKVGLLLYALIGLVVSMIVAIFYAVAPNFTLIFLACGGVGGFFYDEQLSSAYENFKARRKRHAMQRAAKVTEVASADLAPIHAVDDDDELAMEPMVDPIVSAVAQGLVPSDFERHAGLGTDQAKKAIGFFRLKTDVCDQQGLFSLGDVVVVGKNATTLTADALPSVRVGCGRLGVEVAHPLAFELVWHMKTKARRLLTIWRLVPPAGFVAMGYVARLFKSRKSDTPDPMSVVCVRQDLAPAYANRRVSFFCDQYAWSDRGTGASVDVRVFMADSEVQNAGLFVARNGVDMRAQFERPPVQPEIDSADRRKLRIVQYGANVGPKRVILDTSGLGAKGKSVQIVSCKDALLDSVFEVGHQVVRRGHLGKVCPVGVQGTLGVDIAHPVGYALIWANSMGVNMKDGVRKSKGDPSALWRPIPPPGFRALGCVATSLWVPPALSDVVCVNEALVRDLGLDQECVWSDRGTGVKLDVTLFANSGAGALDKLFWAVPYRAGQGDALPVHAITLG